MPDKSTVFEPPNVKYLGIYFDNKLSFKRHIDILNCKLSRMVGVFWKAAHLSTKTKKIIYHSQVESHLNYGILMWGSNFSKNILQNKYDHIPVNLKNLHKTLNKIIRAISRKPKYDKQKKINTVTGPLYIELDVLKIADLYYYNLSLLVHEYYHTNTLPSKLSEKFHKKEDITKVRTRHNELDLYYQVPHLNTTYKKPTRSSAAFWNTLPKELRQLKSKNTFKIKLKQYLIDRY